MSDDVLITPASRKVEFFDTGGNIDGKIELSTAGDLNITSTGKITIGDITQDIHIGDGTQAVDLVFDFASSIYSVANQDLTIGKGSLGGNDVIIDGAGAVLLSLAGTEQVRLTSTGLGIGTTSPTDSLAVRGGIKIGEFNDTDGTGYAGTSPPSAHNLGTGASDPQIRVSGRSTGNPGIIQLAQFDANNFLGGTTQFELGRIQFAMNENSNEVTNVAEIRGVTTNPHTPGHFDGSLQFWTSQGDASSANLTQKMILTPDGKIGIGTEAPEDLLHISKGNLMFDQLGNQTSGNFTNHSKILFRDEADSTSRTMASIGAPKTAWSNSHHALTFNTGSLSETSRGEDYDYSIERMRIDSAGNVGIGTDSPTHKLHLHDASRVDIKFSNTGDESHYIRKDGDYLRIRGEDDSTVLMEIRNNSSSNLISFPSGNVGVGISVPVPKLHVYANNSTTNQTTSGAASITIEQDGAGDAALNFLLTGTRRWIMGIDNSLSDKFVLSTGGTDLNTGAKLSVDTSGNLTMAGGVNGTNASFTGSLTVSNGAVINGSHTFVNAVAITQNGAAINGSNFTKCLAMANTYAFSNSYSLVTTLAAGAELELFRFNVTNAGYREFQAGKMYVRVQDTATGGFFQQTVTFGDTGADVLQSTTDRLDSNMISPNNSNQQAWNDEKATIVVSKVSDYICVKFKNDTGATIATGGFSARVSVELFEMDAIPS
tara:strand:+ start:121 stop:2256 length:2136 start_codon:yes stop_codon:yes gene_type:complete